MQLTTGRGHISTMWGRGIEPHLFYNYNEIKFIVYPVTAADPAHQ